jgi:hypothetical protein
MMDRYTPVLVRAFFEFPEESANDASAIDVPPNDSDVVARSESNVLQWMSYLPDDCVKTMIRMGWDVTT